MRKTRLAMLQQRVKELEYLCAELYQVAGEIGAPVRILDALDAAQSGRPLPKVEILPFSVSELESDK